MIALVVVTLRRWQRDKKSMAEEAEVSEGDDVDDESADILKTLEADAEEEEAKELNR